MGVHSPGCRDIWWLGREGPGNVQPYQQEVVRETKSDLDLLKIGSR